MKQLLQYLSSIPAGPISDTAKLEPLLVDCWDEFAGSEAEAMTCFKLRGRMEDVEWNPPVLNFVIERHGGTVMGSTRADLQLWSLDVEAKTASWWHRGRRQVHPMAARLDVRPMAEEIARLVIDRQEDERLKWYEDGRVRVQIGKILPQGSAYKQTLEGRRRRFRRECRLGPGDRNSRPRRWKRERSWCRADRLRQPLPSRGARHRPGQRSRR